MHEFITSIIVFFFQADFANKDAKAAFFARLERLEGPARPRPFHPSGPMYPMDGMPPMMMGPVVHLDYYGSYPPYMDDYYGGAGGYHRPRPPMRPPFEPRGFGDYEDELRAFGRKRERERRIEKEEERRKRQRAYSSGDSSDSSRARRRRRRGRRSSSTDNSRKDPKGNNSSDEYSTRDKDRRRNTRKSHEHREKQRSTATKSKKDDKQREKKSPPISESTNEDLKKVEMKEDVKVSDDELSEESEQNVSGKEEQPEDKKEIVKPKVVINYEDEDEQLQDPKHDKEANPIVPEAKISPSVEQLVPPKVIIEEVVPNPPAEEVEEVPRPPSPPPKEEESLVPATERPKISIAWKGRDRPQQLQQAESNTRIESDLSSGDDFDHMDEDEIVVPEEQVLQVCEKVNTDNEDDKPGNRDVILSHSSETGSEGGERKGTNKNRPSSRDMKRVSETKSYEDRYRHRYNDERTRARNQDHRDRGPPDNRHRSRYQDHKRHGISPSPRSRVTPPIRSRSPSRRSRTPPKRSRTPPHRSRSPPRRSSPLSPRNRARTPIQRPHRPKQHGSPQREVFRGRHAHSPPPYGRRKETRLDIRDRREAGRERSPHRTVEKQRLDSPSRHSSPPASRYSRHRHNNSRSPSPTRHSSRVRHRKEESRSVVVPSRPRTPSGSPPPLPPEEPVPVAQEVRSKQYNETTKVE